jgi:hypothetical protein
MEFLNKAEQFFIQLQYCLTIEPEPLLKRKNGFYSLMLKPEIFLKLINEFQIEYPFNPESKIIELKVLMKKENFNINDALKIIENYKKQYWFLDTVIMFESVTDILKRTLKSIDKNVSEEEVNIELLDFQKHLQSKREKIYIDLINEIRDLSTHQIDTKTDRLKVKQIALFHAYEEIQITRENAGEIAAKYGYKAKTSGEGLFQDYIYYISPANRRGKPIPCTAKKLKNKIELFESIVNLLSDKKKQKAIDEIGILKIFLENDSL